MFAAERIRKIKNLLLEYKHMDVNTLCSFLSCSVATVRRDLEQLEAEGFLTRAYGGAILNEGAPQRVTIVDEPDPYAKNKAHLAEIAATMVEKGDVVYLGPGTTCLQIAKKLRDKEHLTVVTTNINIALELSGIPGLRLILPGGDLTASEGSLYTVGLYAENNLREMYINKSFFSVDGVSLQYGYTLNNHEQASLMKSVIERSDETIIAADLSKFSRRAFVKVLDILDVKKLITDVEISDEYKEFLFKHGVQLFTSFEED